MVDDDIVARRVLALGEALTHLESSGGGDAARLAADAVLQAAVERWLQVAVEACIDVAYHVVAAQGWTPPDTARAAFLVLARHGMIDEALAQRLGAAAAMRNILVHDYVAIDLALLARTVRDDLDDLRRFGAIAARLLGEQA